MNIKGLNYLFAITDNILVISDIKGKLVCSAPLQNVFVLFFCEKNTFGAGQLILSISGRPKPIIESFREKNRSGFVDLYSFLAQHCLVMNLPYLQAVQYVHPLNVPQNVAPVTIQLDDPLLMPPDQTAAPGRHIQPPTPDSNDKPSLLARIGATKKNETRCSCLSCGHQWAYGEFEQIKNKANSLGARTGFLALNPAIIAHFINNQKDLNQCPQCGSRKIKKRDTVYWVDSKGNAIT